MFSKQKKTVVQLNMELTKLKKQGRYGKVYVGKYHKNKAIFKTNTLPDVNLEHERDVMRVLNGDQRMKTFFPRLLDYNMKDGKQCIIMEYINQVGSLYDLLDDMNNSEKNNIYAHLYHMLRTAQEVCQFTHYDIHFDNVLIVRANSGKHVYVVGGKRVTLPYFKYRPILIDFGFSHCKGVSGLQAPMTQTHHYMNPMKFCPHYDIYTVQKNFDSWGLPFDVRRAFSPRRLRLSLFDLLTRITGCSTYERETDVPVTTSPGQWIDKGPWRSVRSLLESRLFKTLSLLTPDISPIYRETIALDSPDVLAVLTFWIRAYQLSYTKFRKFNDDYVEYIKDFRDD